MNSVETPLAKVSHTTQGWIEIRFKQENYEVDVEDQAEIRQACAKLSGSGEVSYPLLVIPGSGGSVTKEAREVEPLGSKPFDNLCAIAIVSDSLHQRFLANFYFKVRRTKTEFPYKFFKNEQEAGHWLKQWVNIDTPQLA